MEPSTCVFTIASKNYLSHVRTLLSSVSEHHPRVQTCLVLCDRFDDCFDPSAEAFQTITAEELGIDRWPEFAFKHTRLELNTAVKPYAINAFFRKCGCERVIYLDPDIVVYRPLRELFDLLERHSVVLTPHLTDFLPDDGQQPDNVQILKTGANNLGFIALRRGERVFQLVDWWCKQLYDQCRVALADGVFVDQKWMDLVLSCVESSTLLRHPGYNAAYWNLPHRKISRDSAGKYLVNGEPLGFFHFSGFNPRTPTVISKHQTRLSWRDLDDAAQSLYRGYAAMLAANGCRETSAWPYAYAAFRNGTQIPDCFRAYLRNCLAGKFASETDVFGAAEGAGALWNLFQSPVDGGPLTVGAMAVHRHHPDLRAAFPDVPGKDALRYAHWFARPGGGETRIESALVEPVRGLLAAAAAPPRPRRIRRIVARGAAKLLTYAWRHRNLVNRFPPQLRTGVKKFLNALAQTGLRPQAARPPHAPVEEKRREPGINAFGLFDAPAGVGEAARGNIACFERLGIPLHRIAFDEQHLCCGKAVEERPDPKRTINYCHLNADCTGWLRDVFGPEPFAGRFNIGYWAWELDEFPAVWDWAADFYNENLGAERLRPAGGRRADADSRRSRAPLHRDRQVPPRRPEDFQSAAQPPGHPLHVRRRQFRRPQEPDGGHRGGRTAPAPRATSPCW